MRRDLRADLEEWHSDLIHGTRDTDWFYLVDHYIDRAITAAEELAKQKVLNESLTINIRALKEHKGWYNNSNLAYLAEENDIQKSSIQDLSCQVAVLRDCLNDIYPIIAGRVIQLKEAGEEKAMNEWNEVAKQIIKIADSPDPGEKYRAVVETAKDFMEFCFPDNEGLVVCDGFPLSCERCEAAKLRQALASLEGGRE